jgi:hydroxymethylglutaryl-CoA reductase
MILAATGLAQNLSAIRALASEGIQKGHMRLHAKNIAVLAGAKGALIEVVAKRMADESNITVHRAKQILVMLHKKKIGDKRRFTSWIEEDNCLQLQD